jgi:hypothetical protein
VEEIVVEDKTEENKVSEKKTGLVMFSGGYDSTAVLHKLIVSGKFSELEVVYEKCQNFAGEYETNNAKKVYEFIKKKYAKRNEVELKWIEENINLDWIGTNEGMEICLAMHLMTIMRHGEVQNFYLGWNKSNVETLDISKKMLEWFEKMRFSGTNIYFLENLFNGANHYETKAMVVRYLLDCNLFDLPYTSSGFETEEEFKNREYWYKNNAKEMEVATALTEVYNFDSKDLSNIFSFKTTKQVQELFNKKRNEEKEKEENANCKTVVQQESV